MGVEGLGYGESFHPAYSGQPAFPPMFEQKIAQLTQGHLKDQGKLIYVTGNVYNQEMCTFTESFSKCV